MWRVRFQQRYGTQSRDSCQLRLMSVFGLSGYKNDERLCKKKLCRQEYLHEIERFWFNDAIIMFHRLSGGGNAQKSYRSKRNYLVAG